MQGGDWREERDRHQRHRHRARHRPARAGPRRRAFLRGHQELDLRRAPRSSSPAPARCSASSTSPARRSTYQRNNLDARRRRPPGRSRWRWPSAPPRERIRLLEACLERLSAADAAGLLALDRSGRLVHRAGRDAAVPVRHRRTPAGPRRDLPVEEWAELPAGGPGGPSGSTRSPSAARRSAPCSSCRRAARLRAEPRRAASVPRADPDRSSFASIIGAAPPCSPPSSARACSRASGCRC